MSPFTWIACQNFSMLWRIALVVVPRLQHWAFSLTIWFLFPGLPCRLTSPCRTFRRVRLRRAFSDFVCIWPELKSFWLCAPAGRALLKPPQPALLSVSPLPEDRDCMRLTDLPVLALWVEVCLHWFGSSLSDCSDFSGHRIQKVRSVLSVCSARRNGLVMLNDSELDQVCLTRRNGKGCIPQPSWHRSYSGRFFLSRLPPLSPPLLCLPSATFRASAASSNRSPACHCGLPAWLGVTGLHHSLHFCLSLLCLRLYASDRPPRPGFVGRGLSALVRL